MSELFELISANVTNYLDAQNELQKYSLCSGTYLNVKDGVTAVDDIKSVLWVFLGGAVGNLKLNRARAPNGALDRE